MSSVSSRNIILIVAVMVVIILAGVITAFFAFTQMDSLINVNSAFYVDNIIDKQPVNGKFLIMNVTVNNKGNNSITVSTDQFVPYSGGKPVDKYSVFSGEGTDLQKQVQVPVGASKNIIVVFDIGNQTPDSLQFQGPLSIAPTYKTSSKINKIAPQAPFDGMTQSTIMNLNMISSQYMGISATIKMNGSENSTYLATNDLDIIKDITVNSETANTVLNNGQNTTDTTGDNKTSMANIKTGLNETGDIYIAFLPKSLQKASDTFNAKNETLTLKGSEKIDVMGKKVDCWVVDATTNQGGVNLKATMYYDKTTRMAVKAVFNDQNITIPDVPMSFTASGEQVMVYTNAPLIGLA